MQDPLEDQAVPSAFKERFQDKVITALVYVILFTHYYLLFTYYKPNSRNKATEPRVR